MPHSDAVAIISSVRSAGDASPARATADVPSSHSGLVAVALCVIAIVWTLAYVAFNFADGQLAWDVRFAYLPAAEAVVARESPYPGVDDPILEEQKGYVYPPQLVVVLVPLAPLPVDLVALLATAAMLALLAGTLRVLEIRDVRCFAAVLLWMPTMSGVLLANVSIPLAFALAIGWRYRASVWPNASALGLAVSAKLLLWPMLVWMVATRRFPATFWAIVIGAAVTAGTWAALGFDGLVSYPDLLRRLSDIQSGNSYSFVGMATTLGLGESIGRGTALLVGGGTLTWCVRLARRGDDVRAFTCAVGATLALSPIVWLHYLVLLVVPLAIARPRFSPVWLVPILLVVSPRPGYAEGIDTFLPALVTIVILATLLARPAPHGAPRQSPA
jgi:alpha-1,2-mannosyltransferase